MPGKILNENYRYCCIKNIYFFIKIRAQSKPDAWDFEWVLRKEWAGCMSIYCTLFSMLKDYYKACSLGADVRRLTPGMLQ